jgi:hypothetical protein
LNKQNWNVMKLLLITCLFGYSISLYAQPCETGVLDPRVAHSLQTYLADLPASAKTSAEQVKNLKMTTPAVPEKDVIKFKITADSIPVQLYNPTHQAGITDYHQFPSWWFCHANAAIYGIRLLATSESLSSDGRCGGLPDCAGIPVSSCRR